MQSNTWNNTNQHWIPQFLLKGFGTHKRNKFIYKLDSRTNFVTKHKVSEIASKSHLLTEQDDKLLSEIEGYTNQVIDAIRKNRLESIDKNKRQAVDKLVMAMMINDPYVGVDVRASHKIVISEAVCEYNKAAIKYGGILDTPGLTDLIGDHLPHDYISCFMDPATSLPLNALRLMGLQVFISAEGSYFIIGDSPVLVIRGVVNNETSLSNRGSQVILPISSRCMLMYSWATETNVIAGSIILEKEHVRSLNSAYYHGTKYHYIYGRDEETLRKSHLPSLTWIPREHSNNASSGWKEMQDIWNRWKRDIESLDVVLSMATEYEVRELYNSTIPSRARLLFGFNPKIE